MCSHAPAGRFIVYRESLTKRAAHREASGYSGGHLARHAVEGGVADHRAGDQLHREVDTDLGGGGVRVGGAPPVPPVEELLMRAT